jgi:hypothetical protein
MNENDYSLIIFEIVPLERLGLDSAQSAMGKTILALQSTGFEFIQQADRTAKAKWFGIRDKVQIRQLVRQVFPKQEDELVWLVTEFFQYLFILPTEHDLLFGLASTNDPNQTGPYGREPSYIASEVGGYTYPPAIARVLAAGALAQHGFGELGRDIDCTASFPRETALAGDIVFIEPPIEFDLKIKSSDTGFEWRPLSVLSSKMLLSQGIVEVLRDESILSQVEIAKAMPFQLFSVGLSEERLPFSLFNHFSIRARKGTSAEVLNELLGVSLHLNWTFAKEYTVKLPKDQALAYALMQNMRLKRIEEKESSLKYAISVLQKRYPAHPEIVEWEVNNLYSNIVRFSPVHLAWKSHLQAFIQGEEHFEYRLASLIAQLDWHSLEQNSIASIEDAQRIIELLGVDPGSTLTRMRVIIEKIVTYIFKREFPSRAKRVTLGSMIHKLDEAEIFPPIIYIYLNTLRLTGNIGAHDSVGSKEDVEAVLPIFVRVVEWFLDEELKEI